VLCGSHVFKEALQCFEAHTIRVLMKHLLRDILGSRDSSKRIRKWATELSEYVINFERRSTIKS
jgi:hypothetical protein